MAYTPKARKELDGVLKLHQALNLQLEAELKLAEGLNDYNKQSIINGEIIANNQMKINEMKQKAAYLTQDEVTELTALQAQQRKLIENEKQINKQLENQKNIRKSILGIMKDTGNVMGKGLKFLMEQDKIIKNTILNLGLSGAKADLMRGSFEQSAGFVASLGGNLEDVQKIMEGFADETGRARVLSAQMVQDITAIGKGTGLGIEQATKLGAQFEYMGMSAKGTMDYVQGIVDTSERMGVNTTKVMKNLSDNFRKLQTFTFTKGSKAMAEMAMNAQKMRVDMADVLNLAEATRGLENIIEMTANLQVMGGEFSKLDPFQALYMSRNEPEKWTETLSEMTRGLFTFKKNSQGVFEKFISPVDADRLRNVAKSLGISEEKIFEIGQRRLDLDKMNQDMMAMGLSPREKELIQGAAIFNEKSAKFQVMLAGEMRDISTLTQDQARSFAKEQVLLKDRAKEAMTFDEALKATLNELKSQLLPILRSINDVLKWTRTNILEPLTNISKSLGAWGTGAGLIAAALIWKSTATFMNHTMEKWVSGGNGMGRSRNATGTNSGKGSGRGSVRGKANPNAGKGLLRGGAGIGAAGAGIGAGIGLAAVGISELADAMSKLDATQVAALPKTLYAMAGAAAAFTIPLAILGATATVSTAGLLALGAVAVGVGAGIGLAAVGIGKMGEGLSKMFENAKGSGKDMLMIAGSIAGIAGALALFSNPLSAMGLGAFAGVMGVVTVAALASSKVANSFADMGTAMKGTKEDWIAVEQAITSISKANFKGGALTDLANMLKNPLKVQFADKEVALNTYVTLDVNGEKFHQSIGTTAHVVNNQNSAKHGLGTIFHR